jgi:hypothetical protein
MLTDIDIQKLQSKYRVKTKSQKDSHRDLLAVVKLIGDALQNSFDGWKKYAEVMSRPGVSFTWKQRFIIRLMNSRVYRWLIGNPLPKIQKIILDNIDNDRH